jgi:hypothetical protein
MYRRILALLALPSLLTVAQAQQFKLFDRNVQVHGFVSQGYVYTSGNNWLTMDHQQWQRRYDGHGNECLYRAQRPASHWRAGL